MYQRNRLVVVTLSIEFENLLPFFHKDLNISRNATIIHSSFNSFLLMKFFLICKTWQLLNYLFLFKWYRSKILKIIPRQKNVRSRERKRVFFRLFFNPSSDIISEESKKKSVTSRHWVLYITLFSISHRFAILQSLLIKFHSLYIREKGNLSTGCFSVDWKEEAKITPTMYIK